MTEEPKKTGLYTIEELRGIVQTRVEEQRANVPSISEVEWENTLLLSLLLHIYDGLDIMDNRILTIEEHLSSLSNASNEEAWNREHNPHTYTP